MRIFSFFEDHVPSLYFVPSTLDLLRLCLCFACPGESSPSDDLCRWEGGLLGPFVAPVELVRGGTGFGGWNEEFMVLCRNW